MTDYTQTAKGVGVFLAGYILGYVLGLVLPAIITAAVGSANYAWINQIGQFSMIAQEALTTTTWNISNNNANYDLIYNQGVYSLGQTILSLTTTKYFQYVSQAKQLNISFFQDGTATNTKGQIHLTKALQEEDFEANNISKYLLNLDRNIVKVYFGNITGDDYEQQYQFINNGTQHITEEITLMKTVNGEFYVQVINNEGHGIENAYVKVYMSDPTNDTIGTKPMFFVGQYITDKDGITEYIQSNTNAIYYITATKTGYTYERTGTFKGDEYNGTKKQISLSDSNSVNFGLTKVIIDNMFTNRSASIYGTIYSPSSEEVQIQTTWRHTHITSIKETLGEVSPWAFYLNSLIDPTYPLTKEDDVWPFELTPGTHFNQTSTENINLSIYVDGTYYGSLPITYVPDSGITKIIPKNSFDNIGYGTLGIFIILTTILTGFAFKSQNAGEIGFIGSIIIAGIIKPLIYILLILIAIRYIAKMLTKIRQDD